jgi:hypothetical protein
LKQSTLVAIAVTFLVGIAAVVWVCYISFKGSVMAFDSTNAPGPLVTPPPARPPVYTAAPAVAPAVAPARSEFVFPTSIPIAAPAVVTPVPNRPNGPPPPDG